MAAPLKSFNFLWKFRKCIGYTQLRKYSVQPPHSLWPIEVITNKIDDVQEDHTTWQKIQKDLDEQEKAKFPEAVDIGVQQRKQFDVKQARKQMQQNRFNEEMEKTARLNQYEVSLTEVSTSYMLENGPEHAQRLADHYGIYQDLFQGSYFLPVVNLGVAFNIEEEMVLPVHTGNRISPEDAKSVPSVEYEAEEDSLWTLIMTNPDGHLTDNESEYLHWMVGNIRGSDIETGEVLCDYLQPFPPKGTGLHRHIFILFKQETAIDYSKTKISPNSTSLKERSFKTMDFYREHSENITPMGLRFFQSAYDHTVREIYHNVLNMKEPVFEFAHPTPYRAIQKKYPKREAFDRYFDRYRDKKDLAEEAFRKKLEMISPFSKTGYIDLPKYPNAHRVRVRGMRYVPTWVKRRVELMNRRIEQFSDLPKPK